MAIVLKTIAGLALLTFLPGFLWVRVLRAKGWLPEGLSLFEWIFTSLLISVLISSWISLLLAELALFSLSTVTTVLLAISLALIFLGGRTPWRLPRPTKIGTVLVPLLAALAFLLYSPPYEYILGNWDPGTYVNAGAHLARGGSITIHDRVLKEIPPKDRNLFYHIHLITQRYEGGMAIEDSDEAIVSPHFYHLYTCWIALFHALSGVRFSLWVNVLFGLLSLAAIYLASRELAGKRTALLTAIFIMCSAAVIWNVRFPTSEIVAQFFLWGGLLYLFRYQREGRGMWAVFSGVCFAEAFLTRITAIVVLPSLILILFWRNWNRWQKKDLFFLIPIAAGLIHLLIQDITVCRSYSERQLEVMRSQGFTTQLLIYTSLSFLAIIVLGRIFLKGGKARLQNFSGTLGFRIGIAILLVSLFALAYYIRPLVNGSADARNLAEFGWFVYPIPVGGLSLPLGLYLALAAVVVLIMEGLDERRGSFLLIVLPVSVFFLYRKMIFPSYLWAVRRYIPLVFPATIFFMSYALSSLGRRNRPGILLSGTIAILLIASMQLRYVARVSKTDFPGTVDFMDSLASSLDRDGLHICEGSGMAAPLDYIYDLDLLQLSRQTPEKCRGVERVIGELLKGGRRIYYISRGGWPISQSLNFIPLRDLPLHTDYLEHSVGRFPLRRNRVQVNARLFRIEHIGESPEGGATSRLIDIGEDCFGLVEGFHGLESRWGEGGQLYGRWTAGDATIVIPTFGSRRKLQIILRATAGGKRPDAPVPVEISVEGKRIARLKIGQSPDEHRFEVPASALPRGSERAILTISSPTWNPAQLGLEGYPDELGIYIDWLLVKAGA